MSHGQKRIADGLFWFQIFGALAFSGAYIERSLHDITGTSLAQKGLVVAYFSFHGALAVAAHRTYASRLTRQTITAYGIWIILTLIMIGVIIVHPSFAWNEKDTAMMITAGAFTLVIILVGSVFNLTLADAMIKALFAIAYKSVPQILLAWKFLAEGSSGTPAIAVAIAHLTILLRLGQIYFLVEEYGLDRNRFWLATSETLNQITWTIATIAWFLAPS